MQRILALLTLTCALSACLKEEPLKLPYQGFEPRKIGDDWLLSTPEEENMDRNSLEMAYRLIYRDDRFLMARSLLVFRNGKLIAEAYPNDLQDLYRLHNIQSCTKSVSSILTGIALKDELDSLNMPLYDIYPEHFDEDPIKRKISLKDALLMQTGLSFDNSEHSQGLYETETNSAAYVLKQERLYAPGTVMKYNDGAPQLISKAIERKSGKTLSAYAGQKLFEPLAIDDWLWEAAHDGTNFGAFSLFLKPRDLGKIGQLLLNQGLWNAVPIIDSSYIAAATTIQTSANHNGAPYGYYFWILPALKGYCALGHGGQFLLVIPDKNLVVVYTAFPYTNEILFDDRFELMNLIVQGCKGE